jgi:hypothetical protein
MIITKLLKEHLRKKNVHFVGEMRTRRQLSRRSSRGKPFGGLKGTWRTRKEERRVWRENPIVVWVNNMWMRYRDRWFIDLVRILRAVNNWHWGEAKLWFTQPVSDLLVLVAWNSYYKNDGLHLLSQNTNTTTHLFRKKPKQDLAIITNSSTTQANILLVLRPFKPSLYLKATQRSLSLVTGLLGTLPHTSSHYYIDIPVVFLCSTLLWSYRKASQYVSQPPIYRFH